MKKILIPLIGMGILSTLSLKPHMIYGNNSNGDGTEGNPYLISTAEQLNTLRIHVNNGGGNDTRGVYFKLANDIDLKNFDSDNDSSNGNWTPIGLYVDTDTTEFSFQGNFNGDGHVIKNVVIQLPDKDGIGLFGYVKHGSISNLGLENVDVFGNNYYTGGLVGNFHGTEISNTYVTGKVTGKHYAGLLGGFIDAEVINSHSNGSVTGYENVGGLIGGLRFGAIKNSHSDVSVTGTKELFPEESFPSGATGGLIGYFTDSSMINSYAIGDVVGGHETGGLLGDILGSHNKTLIKNSYATGNVTGREEVGGFAGNIMGEPVEIINSYATGDVNAYYDVGGFAGENNRGKISRSYTTGNVSGDQEVGGFIGFSTSLINDCYATGSVQGNWRVGGFAGGLNTGYNFITNSFSTGKVTGNKSVGGFAGGFDEVNNNLIELTNCYWDIKNSTQSSSAVGTEIGLTTEQMKTSNAKTNLKGFDFEKVWELSTGYPKLVWQNNKAPVITAEDQTLYSNTKLTPLDLVKVSDDCDTDIQVELLTPEVDFSIPGAYTVTYRATDSFGLESIKSIQVTILEYIPEEPSEPDTPEVPETPEQPVGDGTEGNPYLISTAEQLGALAAHVNNGGGDDTLNIYFKLTNDIDLKDFDSDNNPANGNWTPIGRLVNHASIGISFDPDYLFRGNFDGDGHVIKNMKINLPDEDYVGFIGRLGYASEDIVIKNLGLVSIEVTGKEDVGGLAGESNGDISNCYVEGSVNGHSNVGGLVGSFWGETLTDSYAHVNVTGIGREIGGLVGYFRGDLLQNAYATGNVTGSKSETEYVGGLIGYATGGAKTEGLKIENVYATGHVSGSRYIAGLAGYVSDYLVKNTHATGTVEGLSTVGGLIGRSYEVPAIQQSYASGNVSGGDFIGGLIASPDETPIIKESFATGNVSGNDWVGGLVAELRDTVIQNSYATGNVTGTEDVGGLVGYLGSSDIEYTISSSFSTGTVSGIEFVGGLVGGGPNSSSDSVVNSYWDTEKSTQSSSNGGSGLTTQQMTKWHAKTNLTGFDFENTWQLTTGYPKLAWEDYTLETPVIQAENLTIAINSTFKALDHATVICDYQDNLVLEVIEDTVNPNQSGVYSVTYRVVDGFNTEITKTISVTVNAAPVITTQDHTLYSNTELTPLDLVEVSDDHDTDIQVELLTPEVNFSVPGVYTVTYRAVDRFGVETIKSIQVTILEYIPEQPEEPSEPETPETPEQPEEPSEPETPETPEQPEEPSEPETPETPEQPEEPSEPETPETPEQPEEPSEPETPETPEQPEEPSEPETPETPEQPEEPSEPETPETPEQPEEPSEPETPETPEQPEEPSEPETPSYNVPSELEGMFNQNYFTPLQGNGSIDSPLVFEVTESLSVYELENTLTALQEVGYSVRIESLTTRMTEYSITLENGVKTHSLILQIPNVRTDLITHLEDWWLEVPEVNDPEIEEPEVETPETNDPEVEDPEIEDSEENLPELEDPELNNPENNDSENDSEVNKPTVEDESTTKPNKPSVETGLTNGLLTGITGLALGGLGVFILKRKK